MPMTAQLIDGNAIAASVRKDLSARIAARTAQGLRAPGLAVILVGADPASQIYVRNKRRACESTGVISHSFDLPADITEAALLDLITGLNEDATIDGILVQLPLPRHIETEKIIEHIRPDKDVDGFHPYNIGRLAVRAPLLRPCTPYGVIQLLRHTGETFFGREALVVGVSNHVGRPLALELLLAGATVECCHRFTRNLEDHVRRAEIVVVAAGKPGLIEGRWIQDGATVVDVGIHRRADGTLQGDVEFEVARERAAWITPVPGGVGPMTVATLLTNTLYAAERLHEAQSGLADQSFR